MWEANQNFGEKKDKFVNVENTELGDWIIVLLPTDTFQANTGDKQYPTVKQSQFHYIMTSECIVNTHRFGS